ncbi:MAG: hypothetical protein CMH53_04525 [Myxococcales bacterium]|nr:hypothetical protein [Myxococcales bacterium]
MNHADLLFFLVGNLPSGLDPVTAQSISSSNVFDADDALGISWEMLHYSTQEEIASDVSHLLNGMDELLGFLA